MEIYITKNIYEIDDDSLQVLQGFISHEKIKRVSKYYKLADRQRSIVGEALIRWILSCRYNLNNDEMLFTLNEYGKPYLKYNSGIEFNISHSGNIVVCAIDVMPIGIDIEKKDNIDLNIAEHFFSDQEYKDLMKLNVTKQLDYFYDLWTLKESYIKAKGKGLSINLNSFSIKKEKGKIVMESNDDMHYFKQYYIDDNYTLSVCAGYMDFPDGVISIKVEDLLQYVKELDNGNFTL